MQLNLVFDIIYFYHDTSSDIGTNSLLKGIDLRPQHIDWTEYNWTTLCMLNIIFEGFNILLGWVRHQANYINTTEAPENIIKFDYHPYSVNDKRKGGQRA